CEIEGSSDASIRNIEVNDLEGILKKTKIDRIFTNGSTAYRLYRKHQEKRTGIEAIPLPSTSPANASHSLERLIEEWRIIL
ncbi:MAG: DNA-deoxyinosine glycosylase, partial [Erysipelotrichaceae bacterium]|nr:DNA-deoxyinosine glycosylase [Erysipelotrichaceae bacterium]